MGVRQDIPNHAVLLTSGDNDDLGKSRGFVVATTGVAQVRLRKMSATVLMPVVAGVYYEADVAQVDLTGSHTAGNVLIFYHQ